ncbi:MAG: sensor domain-containing diguanylate cyclase [Candidatus Cloacimonetes bacterium]|nr:sensor domain-containing diguanylate cyclase [Candidatus Cloacimonadota bacterium]
MAFDLSRFEKTLTDLLKDNNLEENLSKIIRNMEKEFDFQSLGIFLKNFKTNIYRLKISRNLSHSFEKNTVFHECDKLISHLKPLKLLDYYPSTSDVPMFEKSFSHLLVVPLHNNRELLGFIFIDRESGNFDQEEISKLNIFSVLISLGFSLVNNRHDIEQLIDRDELTQLYNHRSFMDRTEKVLSQAKRYKRDLTLLILKLDNFENVIRTIGKDNTDDLIKSIALILEKNLRDTDIIGRIYKDTFAVAMPETHENVSMIAIFRLDEKILELPLMNNYKIGWGVVESNESVLDLSDLINKATEAAFESCRKTEENVTIYR